MMKMNSRPRILVAPLNWGLGHAARMIPVIKELLERNAEVILAADGRPLELLQKEFPELAWIRLPGYNITYQRKGSFAARIFLQIPKIIRSYFCEKAALKKIVREMKIDGVISDNRFGLHHPEIPCFFVTHQVSILLPRGLQWFEPMLHYLNCRLIEKFDQCWIPDFAPPENLTGDLTTKYSLPSNAVFIGPLSRLKPGVATKSMELMLLLSGPEPQRTVFENILLHQLAHADFDWLLVRGVVEGTTEIKTSGRGRMIDYMTSEELNKNLLSARLIVSRSGYSTVMDLASLGCRAVFVPTPGQTEQEYLAEELMKRGITFCHRQPNFSLAAAIERSSRYTGFRRSTADPSSQHPIQNLLHRISVGRTGGSPGRLVVQAT
jgi:UDP:flavonoid glycosyltransferase YjiC (YdhE family)